MIDKVQRKDCVGCKACGDICPTSAIAFSTDREGFWYPSIDMGKCISCNLCEKVCPAIKPHAASINFFSTPKTYKVYHVDKNVRYNSTSGALYYALAQTFIEKGDYIVGCVYDEGNTGAHLEVSNTMGGLSRIMRSKYFQSDTDGIYKRVKELLDNKEKVLFCGTGCQVSALYGFLQKEYDDLYTVELICRGINSPKAFTAYMDELQKKFKSKIKEVHFKNKSHGWTNLGTLVRFENGNTYYRNRHNDPWVNAFIVGNLYIRPSCENCKYKTFPRVADITIGDFWGLNFRAEEEKYGVSVAFVNTEKGDILFQTAKDHMFVESRAFDEAKRSNPALTNSVKLNPKRKEFFNRIENEPYSKVVWDLMGSTAWQRSTRIIKIKIKGFLYPIYRRVKGR